MGTELLKQREADLVGGQQREALEDIDTNFENIRAAWNHAVTRQNYAAVDAMVDGLYLFSQLRGRFVDGAELFEFARRELAPQPGAQPHPVWGRVLSRYPAHRSDTPETRLEQARAIAEQHGQRAEIAHCWFELGVVVGWQRRDFSTAIGHYEIALTIFRELDDRPHIAATLLELSSAAANLGQIEIMTRYAHEALNAARAAGHMYHAGRALLILSEGAMAAGDFDTAEQLGRESMAIAGSLGNRSAALQSIVSVAVPAILRGGSENLAEIKHLVDDALGMAQSYHDVVGTGRAKMLLGYLAVRADDYASAKQYGEAGFADAPHDPYLWTLGNGLLAYAEAGLKQYDAARQRIRAGMQAAAALNLMLVARRFLAVVALYDAYARQDTQRAAERYALAFSIGDSAASAQQTWSLYASLRQHLQTELGENGWNAAWERGKALDLNTVVQEFLAEFENDG